MKFPVKILPAWLVDATNQKPADENDYTELDRHRATHRGDVAHSADLPTTWRNPDTDRFGVFCA